MFLLGDVDGLTFESHFPEDDQFNPRMIHTQLETFTCNKVKIFCVLSEFTPTLLMNISGVKQFRIFHNVNSLRCVPGMKMFFLNVQVINKLKLRNNKVSSSRARTR